MDLQVNFSAETSVIKKEKNPGGLSAAEQKVSAILILALRERDFKRAGTETRPYTP
jgi:hypothetical protein